MRLISIVVAISTAFFAPPPAFAAEPTMVKPSSPWTLDYADDSCALRRSFADGDKAYFLELRQFSPGEGFEVTVASTEFNARLRSAKVRFLPEAAPRTIERPLPLVYSKGLEGFRWTDSLFPIVNPTEPKENIGQVQRARDEASYKAREGAVQGLEIGGLVRAPIILRTGEMHRPMSGMRKCLDELITHWGVDAPAQKTLTRAARPVGQAEWARQIQANYPDKMLNGGKSGRARVRMIVGPDGKPTSCHVQSIVTDAIFGQTACNEMMKAARFDPALDAAGKPIASYYVTMISYTIN